MFPADTTSVGIVCPSPIVCEGLKLLLQVGGTLSVSWCVSNWRQTEGMNGVSLVVCTVAPTVTGLPWLMLDEARSPASGQELRSQVMLALGQPATANGLTPKELQLIRLLARGISRQRAACAMQVSENTVKSHLGSLYRKLRVRSRTEAVVEAARRGLVSIGAEDS